MINASIKSVGKAILNRDARFIQELAQKQVDQGADYLDVNVATGRGSQQEAEDMTWAVKNIQDVVDVPLAIDTADPRVLEAGLKVHRSQALVNSISAEPARFRPFLELSKEYGCLMVALPVKDEIPAAAQARLDICKELLEKIIAEGFSKEDIYFDPLVLPLSVNSTNPQVTLNTLKDIKKLGAKTIIGLSNISFGLPKRDLLNFTFLVMAMQAGLDAAILNPLEKGLMAVIVAARAILGHDEHCLNYVRAYRQGRLE